MSERDGLLFSIGYAIPIVIFVIAIYAWDWWQERKAKQGEGNVKD